MKSQDKDHVVKSLGYVKTDLQKLADFLYGKGEDQEGRLLESVIDAVERFTHIYQESAHKV